MAPLTTGRPLAPPGARYPVLAPSGPTDHLELSTRFAAWFDRPL